MDNKIMVNSAGNAPGRTVEVARDAKEMPVDQIAAYYDFPSSKTQSFDTYSNRMSALASALGNKDEAKG